MTSKFIVLAAISIGTLASPILEHVQPYMDNAVVVGGPDLPAATPAASAPFQRLVLISQCLGGTAGTTTTTKTTTKATTTSTKTTTAAAGSTGISSVVKGSPMGFAVGITGGKLYTHLL
ncbi:hypothetical protein H072_9087 [Dactylellina haptotyla CBS 200.50]|uniref:Uncharacterized protein n=1 Tax=Dactylellina haptotyla (strain CBS 200.50) TaxID=1284197 RepID=S8BDE8_DACHA|nr:hypothetical protein H072_9087 [Dactylellina haptotyla CBS 200.50]